jgi:hypothetical protein
MRVFPLVFLVACADLSGDPQHDLSKLEGLATIDCSSDLMCGSTAPPTCMTDALRDGHVAKFYESLVPEADPNYDNKILFTYHGSVLDFDDTFDRTTGGEDISEQHCTGIEAETATVLWRCNSSPYWTWTGTDCK